MIVVDANILVAFYFPNHRNPIVEELQRRDDVWCAPEVWKSEFMSAAAQYLRKGMMEVDETLDAFEEARGTMLSYDVHHAYRDIVYALKNSKCSAYDCEYVILAQKLSTRLITFDKQILHWFPNVAILPEDFLKLEQ